METERSPSSIPVNFPHFPHFHANLSVANRGLRTAKVFRPKFFPSSLFFLFFLHEEREREREKKWRRPEFTAFNIGKMKYERGRSARQEGRHFVASINPFYCPGLYVGGLTTVRAYLYYSYTFLWCMYTYKKHGMKGKKESQPFSPRISPEGHQILFSPFIRSPFFTHPLLSSLKGSKQNAISNAISPFA